MNLSAFRNDDFDRGASLAKEIAWVIACELLLCSPLPGSSWRACLLRLFGASIAPGVVLKPRIRVKFPWRLKVGDNSWIGEGVWIDNLAPVSIGHDVCVSQGAYLCTGNHDWSSPNFDLVAAGITIDDQCWVGARAMLAPGTHMHQGAIIGMGCVGRGRLRAWTIYSAPNTDELRARHRIEKGTSV